MSKIRQAVAYERTLADTKVNAHREQVEAQEALLRQATEYERKLTDQQFDEIRTLQGEHQRFHDREHILYDDAVERASSAIRSQINVLEADLERLRDASHSYMTTGRFEREHQTLIDRVEASIVAINERLEAENRVTVRQGAQEELLTRISSNNKWMIGILVTVAIFGATTLLHIFRII
jgi:dsDNA-specific endonuclease/ATPase MutS2